MMKWNVTKIAFLLGLALIQPVHAKPGFLFDVEVIGTTVTITTTLPAHTYSHVGIKVSPPASLANPAAECTMAPNGYCLFSASNTISKTISIVRPGGPFVITLCLNGTGALSCQNYRIDSPRFAYVPNFGANGDGTNVSLCLVSSKTGLLSSCETTGSGFDGPTDIILNATKTRAYISNYHGDDVSVCSVDTGSGALSNCTPAGSFGNNSSPQGTALNATGTLAYIALDCADEVKWCLVNNDGTFNTNNCGSNTAFNRPSDIILNAKGNQAYVPNRDDNSISICSIDQTGALINCQGAGGAGFSAPEGVSLNTSGSRLYVGNDGTDFVSFCSVNPATGLLSNCQPTGGGFNGFGNIGLDPSNTYAYVPNSTTVSVCLINAATGELYNCVDSGGTGFNSPTSVLLSE